MTRASHFALARLQELGMPITRLCSDTRQLQRGDVFVAIPGGRVDPRTLIAQAIAAGAAAVIWEADGFAWDPQWRVPNLAVQGLRQQIGIIAAHVYGEPSQRLWLAGITGTNGKTSCSHWIAQSLTHLGKRAAVVGTLGNGFPDALSEPTHTTPDAINLQQQIAALASQGATHLAMEVSSHGLDQGRVNGAAFKAALFTNLSRDHLDYHQSMARYGQAKARLFHFPGLRHAVVNLDDDFGA